MDTPLDFNGKCVIITGGSKGLGRELVNGFLNAGADVVTCARNEPDEPLTNGDRKATFVAADIRDPEQVQAVVAAAVEKHGRVDVLVNNAGGAPPADSATVSPRFNERILALNLLAPITFAQAAYAVMKEQDEGGVILNISSVSGIRANPTGVAYGAAKAGLINVSETLAVEWGPKVRVLTVTVGLIITDDARLYYGDDEGIARVGETIALGKMGDLDEVADVCVFLASPLARWMSGANVKVHGGGEKPAYMGASTGEVTKTLIVSAGPHFDLDHDPAPGVVEQVSPLIRRVTANNPGKFTFKGTGTYIVGDGEVALIDPGPDDPAHVEALLDSLRRDTVTHILITHTHHDHSPAAAALAAATGAQTFAFGPHPPTDRDLGAPPTGEDGEEGGDTDFTPDNLLDDGDVLAGPDWTLEAIHTPGHISNHLCFALRQESALFTGDHIMGWSTTIIPPPDGSLDSYLSSLDLVLARDQDVLWPTHGPAVRDPHDFVEALRDHRLERNNQILRCIASGLNSIDAMVEVMYSDKPAELHKPAGRSVLAHLIRLVDQGRVGCEGEPGIESTYFQL